MCTIFTVCRAGVEDGNVPCAALRRVVFGTSIAVRTSQERGLTGNDPAVGVVVRRILVRYVGRHDERDVAVIRVRTRQVLRALDVDLLGCSRYAVVPWPVKLGVAKI